VTGLAILLTDMDTFVPAATTDPVLTVIAVLLTEQLKYEVVQTEEVVDKVTSRGNTTVIMPRPLMALIVVKLRL
jgi:uncharacterized protein YbbC (DUF1343 family)